MEKQLIAEVNRLTVWEYRLKDEEYRLKQWEQKLKEWQYRLKCDEANLAAAQRPPALSSFSSSSVTTNPFGAFNHENSLHSKSSLDKSYVYLADHERDRFASAPGYADPGLPPPGISSPTPGSH